MTIKTIRQILGDRPLHHAAPTDTVRSAARMMAENAVGALAVLDAGQLVGILSERDIVFRCVGNGLSADETTVAQVMTQEPVTVDIDAPISQTLAVKLGEAYRHMPVIEGDQVVGLLSFRDIPPEYVMMHEHFREMSTAKADQGA